MEKPPLGITPAFITEEARIKDLLDAIDRQLNGNISVNYEFIKTCAKEIYLHADLLLQMESEE